MIRLTPLGDQMMILHHLLIERLTNTISKSVDNDLKYVGPVSEELTIIVRKHYFDKKPKEKVKTVTSKYNLPSNLKELGLTKVSHCRNQRGRYCNPNIPKEPCGVSCTSEFSFK